MSPAGKADRRNRARWRRPGPNQRAIQPGLVGWGGEAADERRGARERLDGAEDTRARAAGGLGPGDRGAGGRRVAAWAMLAMPLRTALPNRRSKRAPTPWWGREERPERRGALGMDAHYIKNRSFGKAIIL